MARVKEEIICSVRLEKADLMKDSFPLCSIIVSVPLYGNIEFPVEDYGTVAIKNEIKERLKVLYGSTKNIEITLVWSDEKFTYEKVKKNFSNVLCYYTGGGIYIYSARYKDVYLYGSLDDFIGCIRARGELVDSCDEDTISWLKEYLPNEDLPSYSEEEQGKIMYEENVLPSDGIIPTWNEILFSILHFNKHNNIDEHEAEEIIRENHLLHEKIC